MYGYVSYLVWNCWPIVNCAEEKYRKLSNLKLISKKNLTLTDNTTNWAKMPVAQANRSESNMPKTSSMEKMGKLQQRCEL